MPVACAFWYPQLQSLIFNSKYELRGCFSLTLPHPIEAGQQLILCKSQPLLHCLLQFSPHVQWLILQQRPHRCPQHNRAQLAQVACLQVLHLEFTQQPIEGTLTPLPKVAQVLLWQHLLTFG